MTVQQVALVVGAVQTGKVAALPPPKTAVPVAVTGAVAGVYVTTKKSVVNQKQPEAVVVVAPGFQMPRAVATATVIRSAASARSAATQAAPPLPPSISRLMAAV